MAASVAVAAVAMLTYEAWWALAAIPFGLVLVGLERQGLSLAAAFAMAAIIAGSLLAQFANARPCDPGPCTSGVEGFVAAGRTIKKVPTARYVDRRRR